MFNKHIAGAGFIDYLWGSKQTMYLFNLGHKRRYASGRRRHQRNLIMGCWIFYCSDGNKLCSAGWNYIHSWNLIIATYINIYYIIQPYNLYCQYSWLLMSWRTRKPDTCSNIKSVFPGMGIRIRKIRRSWDHNVMDRVKKDDRTKLAILDTNADI